MSDAIITVENLGKRYSLRHLRDQRYVALRDVLVEKATGLFRRNGRKARRRDNETTGQQDEGPVVSGQWSSSTRTEEFWALRHINFEVRQGEVVGIIGRNGAGKSTLLKILSRITDPTEGKVTLRGRVASLLEVGTGFHPELTGRENIYLNGAILGMSKAEIRKKFDEIVAFAETEKFLDTPVKRYSSGMYVRLAFAVAAHLDPEILVVDEVLAVGDAEFQRKCLGKMQQVSNQEGRTVLFVSHNMTAAQRLCTRGFLLTDGKISCRGSIEDVVQSYLQNTEVSTRALFDKNLEKPSIIEVRISGEEIRKGNLEVYVRFASPFLLKPPVPGIVIYSNSGVPVFGSNPRFHGTDYPTTAMREGVLKFEAKKIPLASGRYRVSVWLGDWLKDYDVQPDACSFEIFANSSEINRPSSEVIGHLSWDASWKYA